MQALADRYCTNCGNRLSPEDRFCGNCGTPVHGAGSVPTPEADVPIPPPPTQQQPPLDAEAQSEIRGSRQALVVVLGLVGVVDTLKELANTDPGGSFSYQLGYAVGGAFMTVLGVAAVALVVAAVVYVSYLFRGGGVTLRQAFFNWPVAVVAAVIGVLLLAA
jgi:hypothetical protein